MKTYRFTFLSAMLCILSACTQVDMPVENALSKADQEKWDLICEKAVKAGCKIDPDVTLAEKREAVARDMEVWEDYFRFLNGFRVNQETGEEYYE